MASTVHGGIPALPGCAGRCCYEYCSTATKQLGPGALPGTTGGRGRPGPLAELGLRSSAAACGTSPRVPRYIGRGTLRGLRYRRTVPDLTGGSGGVVGAGGAGGWEVVEVEVEKQVKVRCDGVRCGLCGVVRGAQRSALQSFVRRVR